jgi:hypothetical protein
MLCYREASMLLHVLEIAIAVALVLIIGVGGPVAFK